MWKKILVGVAIAFGCVLLIKSTWAGSHLRLSFQKWSKSAKQAVPLERELERLQMEVNQLAQHDERFLDKLARQAQSVKKLQASVEQLKTHIQEREQDIEKMHTALANKDAQVVYQGQRYPREEMEEQLKLDFLALEADEQMLESRTKHLTELKKSLQLNEQKWKQAQLYRDRMAAELQRLETTLAAERRLQRNKGRSLEDAEYRKLESEIEALRDEVDLLKTKRELAGQREEGPVRAAERQREQDQKWRQRLAQRLAPPKS
jgi:septal ring factor EnvC (AmiA/AmiB activator)